MRAEKLPSCQGCMTDALTQGCLSIEMRSREHNDGHPHLSQLP